MRRSPCHLVKLPLANRFSAEKFAATECPHALVAWGQSHCGCPEPEIELALDKLIADGLFKAVLLDDYPDADETGPGLDCTYDSAFLCEIPDGEQHREFWDSLQQCSLTSCDSGELVNF